jgi:hypothetical protein
MKMYDWQALQDDGVFKLMFTVSVTAACCCGVVHNLYLQLLLMYSDGS